MTAKNSARADNAAARYSNFLNRYSINTQLVLPSCGGFPDGQQQTQSILKTHGGCAILNEYSTNLTGCVTPEPDQLQRHLPMDGPDLQPRHMTIHLSKCGTGIILIKFGRPSKNKPIFPA